MMGVVRGPIGAVAGTDQLGTLLTLLGDTKMFKDRLDQLEKARAEANRALTKLSKAKDIDKALKNADAREAKSAKILEEAAIEANEIMHEANAWLATKQLDVADAKSGLDAREKTMLADGKMVAKMAADKMKDAEKREHAANAREIEAAKALKAAVEREVEATAANEKWAAALTRAREVQAALGA